MKICCIAIIIFLFCGTGAAQDWKIIKGEHFLIYYMEDKSFAREVLRRAERYYDKIASDLGYSRYDKFWQWENRVKIYIYLSHGEFIIGTGILREWVQGVALYKEKEIISYRWSKEFFDSLLPHELTHLIFRDFVEFEGEIPLWLDEGVAQWEEKFKRKNAIEIVKGLIEEGSYISIERLMRMDVRKENYELARKFYAQAVTLVGYLIEEYGGLKFNLFCRQLRDGKSMNKALSFVYTNSIRNVDVLERKWVKHYGEI